ncbi:2EXR domain-containing protein [Fusarium sp. LHS14.1]|nr:2EXR domain-containing protein [Fusarium sp. LHS14.1]
MTIFHPFPRLPQEIRDLIWTNATRVQADKSGIHFFTIFNSTNKEESAAVAQQNKLKGPSRSCLAAPRCKNGQGFSWTEGNPSMYLLDRGLWTACRDSRAAIMKVSTMTMCSESCTGCQACSSDDTVKLYDEPRIAKFILDGHEQEMMVWPERDLFCLRPYAWNMAKIWLQHTAISSQHGKFCFKHVAFELPRDEVINLSVENEYNKDAPEPSSHLMVERIDSLMGRGRFHNVEKVWLIDYQLKRVNPRPSAARQFCANGFRLVEVMEQDDDEWTDRRGDGRDALEFAEWLRYSTNYQNENTSPELGVLACEKC